ncbi:hypothetical protein H4R24_001444 [Coemansia sp. RSA 988]|nr:hypothetical protein H4R24_001444 [Coemansia sp. RSA 988]
MFVLGLVSLITAFIESCPSLFFIIIESTLCLCMMMEIVTRIIAMQWTFLQSWWNYFDILIVLFCGITLILLSRGCSAGSNSEELINTILLVIRNAAQIFRLLATLRKNQRQMDVRGLNVDLDNGSSFLDMINDVDNLIVEPEQEYHIHDGRLDGSVDFRLSIDSLSDGGDSTAPSNGTGTQEPITTAHRSDSRSSATSIHSSSDRLTGRKKILP